MGEAGLMGRLSVNLFPKLGVTSGIAQFLDEGADFIDRTSKHNQAHSVFDVTWGSHFPASNGSASTVIAKHALRHHARSQTTCATHHSNVVESAWQSIKGSLRARGCKRSWIATCKSIEEDQHRKAPTHRRYQTLHVLRFNRSQVRRAWRVTWHLLLCSFACQMISIVCLLLASIFFIIFEMYGSAGALFVGAGSRAACQFLGLERPSGYLANNEKHEAWMLTAQNTNASSWYLYTGDRGVIDGLLNKHLILPPAASKILKTWFSVSHALQLLSMTFVAAQKGWDGPAMMVLILLNWLFEWQWNDEQMAETWLAVEGITAEARTFCFTGRTQMLFSILLLSESKTTAWMNSIMAPHHRLEVLKQRLSSPRQDAGQMFTEKERELDRFDQDWVQLQEGLAREGADVLRRELKQKWQQA